MARPEPLSSFAAVIGLWKTSVELAGDIGCGVTTVRQWKSRGRIPDDWWNPVVVAAKKRGFNHVTVDLLALLASERRKRAA